MAETKLDVASMVRLYERGQTTTKIPAGLGITPRTVHRRLVAAGVQMRPPGVRRMPATDDQILRLRREGLLWREVGERVGMSTPGVHRRWRELRDAGHADPMPAGAAKRPRPAGPDPTPAVQLYLTGLTLDQVGDRLGFSRSTVVRRLEAAEVPTRKRGVRHPADDTEILRLRATGLTWREVAAEVGMTESGVKSRWTLLRQAGYEDPVPPR